MNMNIKENHTKTLIGKGLNFIGGCSKLETFFLALLAVEKSNAEKLIVAVKRKTTAHRLSIFV